jgi:S-adenosylmethionine-diacylgycerolhomoserine-N-methlytransferase
MTGVSLASTAGQAMDRMYRYQRHIYDLTRKYYLLGRDRMIAGLDARPGLRVLEIGCGTGRNLILAAQKYPRARFFGIDVSNEMLVSAQAGIMRAGLSETVHVAQADATAFDSVALFRITKFDRIFVSYTLSMIPQWDAALDHAVTMLAPEGELHIVDFGGQERLPGWFRAMLRNWLARFHVTPRDGLETHLAELAARHRLRLTMARPCLGYAQLAVLVRGASGAVPKAAQPPGKNSRAAA